MFIKSLASALIMVLIMSGVRLAAGDSVGEIRNGYFEDGETKPAFWKYQVRSPSRIQWLYNKDTGGKCVMLDCVHGGVSVGQDIDLVPGKEYYLSFKYRFSDITPYVNLHVKFSKTDEVSWRLYPKNIYWTQFIGAFKAKGPKAEISVKVGKKGQRVWLDDFRLTESPPLVTNGCFENPGKIKGYLPGWKFERSSGKTELFVSGKAYKGSFAAGIRKSGQGFISTVIRDINPGLDYEVSGYYFSGAGSIPEIIIKFMDVDGKFLPQTAGLDNRLKSNGTWIPFKIIVHVPREAAEVNLFLGGTLGKSEQILWDDISFKQIKPGE